MNNKPLNYQAEWSQYTWQHGYYFIQLAIETKVLEFLAPAFVAIKKGIMIYSYQLCYLRSKRFTKGLVDGQTDARRTKPPIFMTRGHKSQSPNNMSYVKSKSV